MSLRFSVTGIGACVSLLILLLSAAFRSAEIRKRTGAELAAGEILNAVGFGLLPGIAVWKVFEQNTPLAVGTGCFDPLRELPWITQDGCFAVSRTEIVLAALCFAAVMLWLILRREDLPGNGDLLLTVLCVWGLTRAFTEGLRETTLLRAGGLNVTQILLLAAADVPLAVWSLRLEANGKSTAFAVLEWIAVLSSQAVLVLNTAGVLSAGSGIGDLAVNAGCVLLSMLLILPAGKDSRS